MALTVHKSQTDKTQTPYQVDPEQTLRASQALLKHVQAELKRIQETGQKKNLLATQDSDDEDNDADANAQPIWLSLSTKQYITDKHKLKPSKIPVPNTLNHSSEGNICIITTDPQRAVKNVVADPAFPVHLSTRITRIIGLSKLAARYKTFESRRQLLSEHDIFLADERIISRLPKTLGKVFYKGTAKRPIPIDLAPRDGPKDKSAKQTSKEEKTAAVTTPKVVAAEIEKALNCVPVTLNPGYNIAVRVGLDSFTPEQLRDNVTAVTQAIIDRHVASGWKNVRSIHIKSPTSVALPIWLAEDVFADGTKPVEFTNETPVAGIEASSTKRKRNPTTLKGPQSGERKKARLMQDRANDKVAAASRKARLSAQKAAVLKA